MAQLGVSCGGTGVLRRAGEALRSGSGEGLSSRSPSPSHELLFIGRTLVEAEGLKWGEGAGSCTATSLFSLIGKVILSLNCLVIEYTPR